MISAPDELAPFRFEVVEAIPAASGDLEPLRQELHGWAFANAEAIREEYQRTQAAPLETLAAFSGNPALVATLARYCAKAGLTALSEADLETVLVQVVDRYAERGFLAVVPSILACEVVAAVRKDYGQRTADVAASRISAEWVGVAGRKLGVLSRALPTRKRFLGKMLSLVQIAESYPRKAIRYPTSFCADHPTCDTCHLRDVGCPLVPFKDRQWRLSRSANGFVQTEFGF